jgi:DNA modification methylase
MDVIKIEISKLANDPNNARKHSDKNLKAIKGSLAKFGQQKPIVIDSKNVVIAGNGTLEAAKQLGWTHINAVVTELDDLGKMAFALADNKTSELAEWDDDILKEQLDWLDKQDFDIGDIGFMDYELPDESKGNDGLTDPDDVPEVAQNVFGVKRGDVWILGNHRLMCGDSTSDSDVAKLMDGNRAVFCFTSPPYADMREYNGGKELSTKHLAKFLKAPCDLFAVNLGIQRKDNEIVQYWDDYIQTAKEYEHKFLSWNVWDRSGFGGSIGNQTAMFPIWHEFIFLFGAEKKDINRTKKNKTAGSKAGTNRNSDGSSFAGHGITKEYGKIGTVIKTGLASGREHPAMFPVELPENYYLACSNENDLIYEPFCGSGTSIIAAEKTNRICYGMELDEHYCSIVIKRWQDFTGKTAIKEV